MATLSTISEASKAPAACRAAMPQDTSKVDEEEHSETGLTIASSPLLSSPISSSIIGTPAVPPFSADHHGSEAQKADTALVASGAVLGPFTDPIEEALTPCMAQVSAEVDACPVAVYRPRLASPSWSEDSGEDEDDDDWAWVGTDLFVDAAREAAESLEDEDEDDDVVHAGALIDEDGSDVEGAENYTTDEEDAREASDSEDESSRALSQAPCVVEPIDTCTGPASEAEEIARLIEAPPSMPSFKIKIPPQARSRQQAKRCDVEGVASSSRLRSSRQSSEERVKGRLPRGKKRAAAETLFVDENEDLAESSTGRRAHRPKRLRRSYSPSPIRESGGHRAVVLQDAVNLLSEEDFGDRDQDEVAEAQSQAPVYTLADIAAIRRKVQGCVPFKGCEVPGEQAGDVVLHPLYNYRRPYGGVKKACGWAGCGTSFRHLSREDIRDHLLEHCSGDPKPEKTASTSGSELRETSGASGSRGTKGASSGKKTSCLDKNTPSGKNKPETAKTTCLWTGCRSSAHPMNKDALMKHLEFVHAKLTELICVLPGCLWSSTQQNFTHGRHCKSRHGQSTKGLALVLRENSNTFILLPANPTRTP